MKKFLITFGICAAITTPAMGQSVVKQLLGSKADEAVKNPGKIIELAIPPEMIILKNLAEGKTADEALDAAVNNKREALNTVIEATQTVNANTVEIVRQTLGDDAASVYQTAKLGETLALASTYVVTNKVADVVTGEKTIEQALREVVNMPLEVALQQAYDYYDSHSEPIPDDIKKLLVIEFDPKIVSGARFATSSLEPNIAAITNSLQTTIGSAVNGNHAVTVGNIIVFQQQPPVEAIRFWAHEFAHVEQYNEWKIAGFASRYLTDYKKIESDADARAEKLMTSLKFIEEMAKKQTDLAAAAETQP
ncbi:DUF4157 domain-containing protein [Rhizobium sp. PL01]|uniref:eCIS core domain-containing protein n=1 Tax=Rhizobium sp. PL01 TaxID=3085631 RepID=UPI002981064C|nr:DUF4157 domain-containing protein [Rhizobium sp. PL01]MDW5314094.1 DUF4157 domain-containing protein [Rhizobium sp. PL01]